MGNLIDHPLIASWNLSLYDTYNQICEVLDKNVFRIDEGKKSFLQRFFIGNT